MATKDIRNALIGKSPDFKSEKVEVGDQEIEVKQLTVGDRNKLIENCKGTNGVDGLKLQVHAVIMTAYDPESGEKVFGPGDYDTLIQQPSGGFVDTLSTVAFRVLGISGEEDTEKN